MIKNWNRAWLLGLLFFACFEAKAEDRLAPPSTFIQPVAPPQMVQRPDFLQGLKPTDLKLYFKLIHSNRFNQAKQMGEVYSRPLLKEYHQLMFYKRGGYCKHDYKEMGRFIKSHPNWPFLKSIQKNAECSIPSKARPQEVLEWFAEFEPISPQGRLRYIQALMATGKKQEAITQIKELWVSGNFSRSFERSFIRKYSKHWSKQENIQRLNRLLWQGSRSAALRTASRIDKGYQRLAQARIALRARRGGVDGAIESVPPSLKEDEGLRYERFRWRVRKGRANAAEILEKLECNLTNPAMWAAERTRLVRVLLNAKKSQEAYDVASSHCQKMGKDYAELEWLAGMTASNLGKQGTSLSHFRRSYSAATSAPVRARAGYGRARWHRKIKSNGLSEPPFATLAFTGS